MEILSVNEALDRAVQLDGSCVVIEGILNFEFENISLDHWPKAERVKTPHSSSIWLDEEGGPFGFNEDVLTRWAGKRVVVLGTLERYKEFENYDGEFGYGHFGLWPLRIKARRIDLLKRWQKDHSAR